MITKKLFGTDSHGEKIWAFSLQNQAGLKANITSYGATLTQMHTPDSQGNFRDIVMGFDSLEEYQSDANPYFGATVGRYANRIKNGQFKIDGKAYQITCNEGENHLHGGGPKALSKRNWNAEIIDDYSVTFSIISPHNEEGFPGALSISITYTLNDDNDLIINCQATCDRDTILNITNHSYWNLAGLGSKTIENHDLTIHANTYAPTDESGIPTGELHPLKGSPLDFSHGKKIGEALKELKKQPQRGLDHGFLLSKEIKGLQLAAEYCDPESGRVLEVLTSEPALQVYSANYVGGIQGKERITYSNQGAICFECQNLPDAINHKNFPSPILRKEHEFNSITQFKFRTK